MTAAEAAREYVRRTRDESGPAHDPHSLLVGFLAGAAWATERAAQLAAAGDQPVYSSVVRETCRTLADRIRAGGEQEGGT